MARKRPKLTKNPGPRTKVESSQTQSAGPSGSKAARPLSRRVVWIAAFAAALALVGLGLAFLAGNNSNKFAPVAAATFVGSETCAGCHQGEAELWRGSQHKLAMEHATDKSVLGDFNDATFDYYGVRSRFFRKDGKVLCRDRRARRQARDLRGEIHVRRRSAAAIPGRISRRPTCRRCRSPGTAGRRTRAASAGSISILTRRSVTTTFCTGPS